MIFDDLLVHILGGRWGSTIYIIIPGTWEEEEDEVALYILLFQGDGRRRGSGGVR